MDAERPSGLGDDALGRALGGERVERGERGFFRLGVESKDAEIRDDRGRPAPNEADPLAPVGAISVAR